MLIKIRADSYKAIVEALEGKITPFTTNREYNRQRRFILALKEIKRSVKLKK